MNVILPNFLDPPFISFWGKGQSVKQIVRINDFSRKEVRFINIV